MATDVHLLVALPGNITEIGAVDHMLSLKMNGLAQIARSLELVKSSKISKIVQSYRKTEMLTHDGQQLERYNRAITYSSAILTVVDVMSQLSVTMEAKDN